MDEESTYFDVVLKYGLIVAGIFQLICLVALIFVPTAYLRKMEKEREENAAAAANTATNIDNKTNSGKQKKSLENTRKRR